MYTVQDGSYVKHETANGIGRIEFFHPQSNSLPGELLRKLAQTINDLGTDSSVNVIVLTSGGNKAFCAGASFDELVAIQNEEEGLRFFSGFALVINAIRKCKKFVILRVQGKAVGGGVGIAAAADYTIATSGAAVKLSELAVGIGPFVVGPAVARKVGTAAFSQLSIDATQFRSASWAHNNNLYAEVYDTIEQANEAVTNLADRLAKSSPEAMLELKKVCWEGTENWDDMLIERAKISGRLVLSDFTKNAIAAFKAK